MPTRGGPTDPVADAVAAVPKDHYVLQADGRPLPQTSHPEVISAVLRFADVVPGSRVLEIGTGSGYSTALLSRLAGASGRVTSLEVDGDLAARARGLLAKQGAVNADVVAADGRPGRPEAGPFDRVIAWATATEGVPHAWVAQSAPGGLIVAPVRLTPLAHTGAVVRLRRPSDGTEVPLGEAIIAGSFVPLTDAPFSDWGMPPEEADVVIDGERGRPAAWGSSEVLRVGDGAHRERFGDLCRSLSELPALLSPGESVAAFRAYLIAAFPEGLATASLSSIGNGIGCCTPDSLCLLSLRDGAPAGAGSAIATRAVERWLDEWRARGRPGFERLEPVVARAVWGWDVHAAWKR